MKLPVIQDAKRYTGLYVVDFGDHSAAGFTAVEVAELLESEKYACVKVYKIHNASPDGKMELKGVNNDLFQLEAGMFFYAADEPTALAEYKKLIGLAVANAVPCRTKVHLAKVDDKTYLTAMIYPAEYDEEVSRWLLDNGYRTAGAVEGGTSAVQRYYQANAEIIQRHQLLPASSRVHLSGEYLLAASRKALVR